MTSQHPSRVAKNTVYLTIAYIIQKCFSFFYYIYIARQIGDENLGRYTWALALTGIFALFIEFGLGPVLTREIAKYKERAKDYLSNVIGIKILFSVIVVFALLITINLLDKPTETTHMVYLAALVILLDSFTFSFYSIFRAYQTLKYEALGIIIYQALIVSAGVAFLATSFPPIYLVIAILLGSTFNCIYSFTLVVKKAGIRPKISYDKRILKLLLKIAIPFALAGIFVKTAGQIDQVLLGQLAGDRFVAWYAVAYKLAYTLTFIPGAFATSFFPAMSHYFVTSKEKLAKTFEHAMFYLIVVSIPISVGTFLLAENIILKMYGPVFGAAVISLQIIITGLLFTFLNFPVGNLLNACNKQTINTINMGIALVFNVVINVILIPRYTYIGASIAALSTTVFLFLLGLPWISTIIKYNWKFLVLKLTKTLLASLIMGLAIYFLRDKVNIVFVVALAGVIYFFMIFLTGGIKRQDISTIYESSIKKYAGLCKK